MSVLLLVVLLYLPLVCADNRELRLISQLNKYFNFDHNIFLFNPSANISRFIDTTELSSVPRSIYTFKGDNESIIELESFKAIMGKSTFLIGITDGAQFSGNLMLLTEVKRLQRLQVQMKIGIFFPHVATSKDLDDLFQWSWSYHIINIFVSTPPDLQSNGLLNVFTFNPFGTFDVINVTAGESYEKIFLRQNSNFQRYRFGLFYGVYKNPVNEKLWRTIFGAMNASYEMFARGTVKEMDEMFVTLGAYLIDEGDDTNYVYPMYSEPMVIMVPEALPFIGFEAYFQAFIADNLLGYLLAAVTMIILFLSFFRLQRHETWTWMHEFFDSVVDVSNLLMNDNSYINYRRLPAIEVMTVVPLTFAGMIIVNGILSALQSHFTRPLMQPQIHSAGDLYNSPFHIYTWKDWTNYTVEILKTQFSLGNWADRVLEMDVNLLLEYADDFNTSSAYLHDEFRAISRLRAQKRLNIYGYHISKIKFPVTVNSYLVSEYFPFMERVNEIVHRISQSGLYYQKWRADHFNTIEDRVVQNNRNVLRNLSKETVVDSFEIPTFLFYGWVASTIVFIIELVWKKLKTFVVK